MSLKTEKPILNRKPSPPRLKKGPQNWSDFWFKNPKSLKNVIFTMQVPSLSSSKDPDHKPLLSKFSKIDRTLLLSDEVILQILSKLPHSQRKASSLVCKRWFSLQGRLVRSLKVLDWNFIQSGRLISRFPNLTHVDFLSGSLISERSSGILLTHKMFSVQIGSHVMRNRENFQVDFLRSEIIDKGLQVLASGCPNLRKLVVLGASEMGLLSIFEECLTLQDLELHKCNDNVLRGIAACENLQVLKLVGNVDGFYSSVVSDIGLTILAQGCKRLVKLELCGCEGSFDGIKAIGQCCQMLEELILCDHRMEGGWLAGLSYCENLKTLRFQSCKNIDTDPGLEEYLGSCPTLERLDLLKCQLRDKKSVRALFLVCESVRDIVIQDCWGLDNDMFSLSSFCRRVKFLSLEGCSLLTTTGLESVILYWKELQSLSVVSCKNIKDCDISPELATMFSALKDLKWRSDIKSLLPSSVVGTSMGKKGGKFFKRMRDPKFLFVD